MSTHRTASLCCLVAMSTMVAVGPAQAAPQDLGDEQEQVPPPYDPAEVQQPDPTEIPPLPPVRRPPPRVRAPGPPSQPAQPVQRPQRSQRARRGARPGPPVVAAVIPLPPATPEARALNHVNLQLVGAATGAVVALLPWALALPVLGCPLILWAHPTLAAAAAWCAGLGAAAGQVLAAMAPVRMDRAPNLVRVDPRARGWLGSTVLLAGTAAGFVVSVVLATAVGALGSLALAVVTTPLASVQVDVFGPYVSAGDTPQRPQGHAFSAALLGAFWLGIPLAFAVGAGVTLATQTGLATVAPLVVLAWLERGAP